MKKKIVIALILALMITALTAIMVSAYNSDVIYSENFNGVTTANFTSNQKGKFKANVTAHSSFDIVDNAFVLKGTAESAGEYPSATFEANSAAYTSNHYVLKFKFKIDHNLTGETALCVIGEPRANIQYGGKTVTTNVVRAYVYANGKFMTRIGDKNVGITEKYDTITTTLDPKAWNEAEIEVDGSAKKVYFTINGTKKTYDIPDAIVPSLTYASTKFNIAQIYCGAASVYLDDVSLSYCVAEDKSAVERIDTGKAERISQEFVNLDVNSFQKLDGTFIGANNFCLAVNNYPAVYEVKNGKFHMSVGSGAYAVAAFDKFTENLASNHYVFEYRVKVSHGLGSDASKKVLRFANLRAGSDVFYAELYADGHVTVNGGTATVATMSKDAFHKVTVEVVGAENKIIFSIDGTKAGEYEIAEAMKSMVTSKSMRFAFYQTWNQKVDLTLDNGVIYYPEQGDFLTTLEGSGTSADPYLIQTTADLEGLAAYVAGEKSCYGKYFKQTVSLTSEKLTTPIGGNGLNNGFAGTYNGEGRTVKIEMKTTDGNIAGDCVGMFGILGEYDGMKWNPGTLRNIIVTGSANSAYNYVGGLCGKLCGGSIYDCVAKAYVIGKQYVGGLIGGVNGTGCTVKNCVTSYVNGNTIWANMTVTKSANSLALGGLIGYVNKGNTIDNCYNGQNLTFTDTGKIATNYGGLIGYDGGATIKNCYSGITTKPVYNNNNGTKITADDYVSTLAALNASKLDFNKKWIPAANGEPILSFGNDTVSISPRDDVSLKFQMDLNYYKAFYGLGDGATVYVEFNQNADNYEKNLTSTEALYNEKTAKYEIAITANPAQIGDSVRVYVTDGNKSYDVISSYSIKDYCVYMIEHANTASNKDNIRIVNSCKALLTYGAECQKQFNYKIDALVNDGIDCTLAFDGYTKTAEGYNDKYESDDSPSDLVDNTVMNPKDISFLALDKSAIRFYFDASKGDSVVIDHPSAATGTVKGYDLDNADDDGYEYNYVELTGIKLSSLGSEFDVTVNYNGNMTKVTYSVLQCVRDLVSVGAASESFYDALLGYYMACNYYFN